MMRKGGKIYIDDFYLIDRCCLLKWLKYVYGYNG